MKKILIAIGVIIILIFTYGQYKDYKRFHPESANLKAVENIDLNYYNQETVYNYYEALAEANNYMQMQWSANEIDVRSPESDDEENVLAVAEYSKKIAKVNYYQAILEHSKSLKEKGLNNEDIKQLEIKGVTLATFSRAEATQTHKQMILDMMPQTALYSGEKSAFVYELQKLLVKKGFDIPVDGVYKNITSEALKSYEEKNNFFADGKVDLITLKALLD